MQKCKKNAILFFILFSGLLLSILIFSLCTDTSDTTNTTSPKEETEPPVDAFNHENPIGDGDYYIYNTIYADVSLYTPDDKYFIDSSFNIADNEYTVIKTLDNENNIIEISGKYFFTDKNFNILTELYYDSITEFTKNCKYLKCLLNLTESNEYITDITDIATGKTVKRFLNGDVSRDIVYGYNSELPDFLPLIISEKYDMDGQIIEYFRHGYVDKDFNVIVPPVYDSIMPYNLNDDYTKFVMFKDGKYYLGDRDGNQLSQYTYDALSWYYDFYEGDVFRGFRDGKCCLLDINFNEIIPPVYDLMGVFDDGYAPVVLGDEAFFIDMEGNRFSIGEVNQAISDTYGYELYNSDSPESYKWYAFEPDITIKIRNYLRAGVYFAEELTLDFTNEYVFMPPAPTYLTSAFPSAAGITEEMLKIMIKYQLGVDEPHFIEEKINEIRTTPDAARRFGIHSFEPITERYLSLETGFARWYWFDFVILNVQDKSGGIYEAQTIPIIVEDPMRSMYPKAYIPGSDGITIHYIDELIPGDMLGGFEKQHQEKYSHLTPEQKENLPHYSYDYYHYLLESAPTLDALKQTYLADDNAMEKYKTLTLTFKITDGGLINFAE